MSSRGPAVLILLTLVTSSVVAGCLSSDPLPAADEDPMGRLSAPIYDLVESLHVQVPGHDGKLQDTWVFKPKTDDPEAKFPVFINFSPYWSNAAPPAAQGGDGFSKHMIDHFVPRGYAVVLASVRGTGHSEGCFPIGGIAELEDAYAVIDHFAHVEWSNGHIASGGKSYDGTTIQGVAGYKPHPALKLIFPVSGISDMYRYSYRGGVPYFQGPIFNAYYYAGVGVNQYGDPTNQAPTTLADDVVCPDLLAVQAEGPLTGVHGMYNAYWQERNYNNWAPDVQAAFFFVHGFQDWNVKPDHILPWLELLPEGAVAKAYLHQWEMCTENLCPGGHVYPMRDDWNLTMLRVMDHYLKGIDTGIDDEPAFHVQDSTGTWRTEATWPPADVAPFTLFPHADQLTTTPAEAGSRIESIAEPLTFRFPVEETLHYAGVPVLNARLSTSDPYTAWVAQLWLEHNGTRTWMNEGMLRAYLRDSMESAAPVVPGEMYTYAIEFYPQDDVFPAGSELVLTLDTKGARFGLGAPATVRGVDLKMVGQPAVFAIDLAASELVLPRVDTATRTLEDPQPTDMYCFACH